MPHSQRTARLTRGSPQQPDTPPLVTEIVAGITTFFTMSHIVIVNPTILSTHGTGMPFSGALTATVLVSAAMTLLMGLYANLPFGAAPGMGLNAFFAYTLVLQGGVAWPVALGSVFWAGVMFVLISVTPLREATIVWQSRRGRRLDGPGRHGGEF